MKEYQFDALILKHGSLDAAFIEFPFDVEKEFGIKGQVKVIVTFDGYAYRGSLAKMGHHCHCLGLTQKVRKAIGKNPGDIVHIVLKQDTEPRIVEVPQDFQEILAQNTEAKGNFQAISYTHQKEYVQWITSSKKAETRNNRLNKAIELLLNKRKHP